MEAEVSPEAPGSGARAHLVGRRDVVHVHHGLHPVGESDIGVPAQVPEPAIVRPRVLGSVDPGEGGVELVARSERPLDSIGLPGVLVPGVVEAVHQHQGSGERVAERYAQPRSDVREGLVPGPQDPAGVVPVQVRFGDLESGDRPEGAHVELGAVTEPVVAVGLLDVQQVGQRPRLEAVAEEARPGTEPDVGPEAEGTVPGGLDLQLELVQAESAGVRVRVVERVVPVFGIVRVVGVVGVHQAGDGERRPAGAGDSLGHPALGLLSGGGRSGEFGSGRSSASRSGGDECVLPGRGLPGFHPGGGRFRFASGDQGREQHLEVLDALPQRIQFAADLGFELVARYRSAGR